MLFSLKNVSTLSLTVLWNKLNGGEGEAKVLELKSPT